MTVAAVISPQRVTPGGWRIAMAVARLQLAGPGSSQLRAQGIGKAEAMNIVSGMDDTFNSTAYWQNRYEAGHNSGTGSYGRLADYKADYINSLVAREKIASVIEFGSGDGNQASLFDFSPYLGVDVSELVVDQCRERFASRPGWHFEPYRAGGRHGKFDLSMSLDVLFHLVEDKVYLDYLDDLFGHSNRFVLIFSSDMDERTAEHVRHRKFTPDIAARFPAWELVDNPVHPHASNPNEDWRVTTPARFHLYRRRTGPARLLARLLAVLRPNRT